MADSFLGELKRRKVFRVATGYVVTAWVLLQLGDVVIEPLGLPEWVQSGLIIGLCALFPIVLVLAWIYELTSSGVVRDPGPEETELAEPPKPLPSDTRRLAVLPLTDQSEPHQDGYIGEGIAEEILNAIAPHRQLGVIARPSSFRFRGNDIDMRAIREQLGATHVVTGSVRRSEDQIRVTVALVETETEIQIWAETYRRAATDIFEVQTDIAQAVVRELIGALGVESPADQRKWTISPDAYEEYLLATNAFRNTDFPKTLEYAERSFKTDSTNPLAPSLVAEVYLMWPRYGYRVGEDELVKARRFADEALRIDPEFVPAQAARGMLSLYLGRDFASAFTAVVDASLAQPGVVEWLPVLLSYANRYEQAVEVQRRSVRRDPLNPVSLLTLASREMWIGQRDQAIAHTQRARELNPRHMILQHNDYRWALCDGNIEKARALLRRWGFDPSQPAKRSEKTWLTGSFDLWLAARLYGSIGEMDEARRMAQAIEGQTDVTPTLVAESYVSAGAIDDAYRICDLGIRSYDSGIYDVARPHDTRDPDNIFWKAFESDERYPGFLERLGIDEDSLRQVDWDRADRVLR